MHHTDIDDPAELDARRLDKPFASIDFDFRLSRETGAAPAGRHSEETPCLS